jgi:hypothetical protein
VQANIGILFWYRRILSWFAAGVESKAPCRIHVANACIIAFGI